jgi:hypothetical protein
MLKFRFRTLLIVLALGPPLLWALWAFCPRSKPEPLPQPFSGVDVQYFHQLVSESAK